MLASRDRGIRLWIGLTIPFFLLGISIALTAGGAFASRPESLPNTTASSTLIVHQAAPVACSTATASGSITTGDATQTGRMVRNNTASTCTLAKSFPGVNDFTFRHYDVYTYTNSTGNSKCVTVNVSTSCAGSNAIFSAAYLSSYNPSNISANYLADMGNSPPSSTSYSFVVPAVATYVVVVHEITANAGCSSYSLTINTCDLSPTVTPTPTAPCPPVQMNIGRDSPGKVGVAHVPSKSLNLLSVPSKEGKFTKSIVANAKSSRPDAPVAFQVDDNTRESLAGFGNSTSELCGQVTWTTAVNVTVTGNTIQKNVATSAWDAGAVSTQSIDAGDGYVQATVDVTNTFRMFGLSHGDNGQSQTDIDFAAYLQQSELHPHEGAQDRGKVADIAPGDVVKVAVQNGVVRYYLNNTPVYTSTIAPTFPLLLDTSIFSNGGTIPNASLCNTNTESAVLWLNRFTPPVGAYPIRLSTISILWPTQPVPSSTVLGRQARLLLYQDIDGDGDPTNAALVAQQLITINGPLEVFENYNVNMIAPGPSGDLYIGFEDYWAEEGNFTPRLYPAALDTTQPSQVRSWLIGMGDGTAPDLNDLSNNDFRGTLDSLGLPGNLMVRASGESSLPGYCTPTRTPTAGGPTNTRTPTYTPSITATPTATPTATVPSCGPGSNYMITQSASATIVAGTTLVTGSQDDDAVTTITLPFTYKFYGQNYQSLNASTNGNVQFNSASTAFANNCPPTSSVNNAIFAYWDDLDMRSTITNTFTPGIYTSTTGVSPNQIFNIEWRSCLWNNGNCDRGQTNFEVRLYENSNVNHDPGDQFDIVYGTVSNGGLEATVGAQKNTGEGYTQFECNTGGLTSGLKLNFLESPCLAFAHLSPSGPITVTLNSTFTLDLMVNTGSRAATGQQSYLTFTNSVLQNINLNLSGCTLTNTVTADTTTFDTVLQNSVCNGPASCLNYPLGTGTISYASSSFTNCTNGCAGDYRVARIAFCASSPGTATIHWQFAPPTRDSEIIDASGSIISGASAYTDYVVNVLAVTATPVNTPTPTYTPAASSVLVGHVTWQSRPAQPNSLQQLPITLTLKLGTGEINYASQNTDTYGFFTTTVTGLANGTYNWRVKGPKFLANSGTVTLTGAASIQQEMNQMKTGDCNNDNSVTVLDFNIMKNSFGKAVGDPGYDDRADFTGDQQVTILDFNQLKNNFGTAGAPPINPSGR